MSVAQTQLEVRGLCSPGNVVFSVQPLGTAEHSRKEPTLAHSYPYCFLQYSHTRHLSVPQRTLFHTLSHDVPSHNVLPPPSLCQLHCCSASCCQLTPKFLREILYDSQDYIMTPFCIFLNLPVFLSYNTMLISD